MVNENDPVLLCTCDFIILFQPGIAQSDSVPGFGGGGVSGGGVPEGINHGRGLEAKRNDELLPLKQGDGPDSSQVSSAIQAFSPHRYSQLSKLP